jgi:putative SOS response-associated peptidase YedK
MCNLYSITTNQAAIMALFRVVNRYIGNLPAMTSVFPDYRAPIVRTGTNCRELVTARWGMPSSSKALMDATKKRAEKLQGKGKTVDFKESLRMEPDGGTANIRTRHQLPLFHGKCHFFLAHPEQIRCGKICQYT